MPYSPIDTTPITAPSSGPVPVPPTRVVRYDLNMSTLNAGVPQSFVYFARSDTFAAVTPPAIIEASIGNGAFYFEFDWSTTTATSIRYLVTSNGVEKSDTISI